MRTTEKSRAYYYLLHENRLDFFIKSIFLVEKKNNVKNDLKNITKNARRKLD